MKCQVQARMVLDLASFKTTCAQHISAAIYVNIWMVQFIAGNGAVSYLQEIMRISVNLVETTTVQVPTNVAGMPTIAMQT